MNVALAAIGGALVAVAIIYGTPIWGFGMLAIAYAFWRDERDRQRRPQGRHVDHRKGWR